MTVYVDWDDREHTTLLFTLEGAWTWDEMYEAADKAIEMQGTVTYIVDTIVDFQNSKGLPPKTIAQFSHVTRFANGQTGLIVLAGGGTVLISLFNLFTLIVGSAAFRYCWVSDLDQARKALAARRSSLVR